MIDIFLFSIILLLAISIIAITIINDIFLKIIISAFVSFFSAILYIFLNALDVAFTEIAIGSAISTVLFLITLRLTNQYNYYNNIVNTKYQFNKYNKILLGLVFLVISVAFLLSIINIPLFGNFNNPTNNYVYQAYISESYKIYKVPNIVTMVLGSFRGFDTLGETVVLLIASLGVYLTLTNSTDNKNITPQPKIIFYKDFNYIQTSALLSLMPVVLLYAIYVQLHGDYGPGGGFQAGVIFAVPYILFIVLKASNYYAVFSTTKQLVTLALGVAIYAFTGVATMLLGGSYLDYYMFGKDLSSSYHYGLLSIELGVGITVFSGMLLIVSKFYEKLGNK